MKHYTQRCESSQFHGALSTVRAWIIGKLRYNGIKDLTLSSVINRSTYACYNICIFKIRTSHKLLKLHGLLRHENYSKSHASKRIND